MLSNKNRFHGHGSLRYVYKNGQAERTHAVTMKYSHNPHRKESRVSVVVSKKVLKSAVRRNRVRRRIYEVVRQKLPLIAKPTDVALIVFAGELMVAPQPELEELINQLFTQAKLYKKDS